MNGSWAVMSNKYGKPWAVMSNKYGKPAPVPPSTTPVVDRATSPFTSGPASTQPGPASGPSAIEAGYTDPNLATLAKYGKGLMDPGSRYYQNLQAQMTRQIGAQAEAGQRAAALRGAWSGFGGGASPEMMATAGELGRAGLEAAGEASAGLALQAPQLGAQMLGQTFAPQLGYAQLGENARQFGLGLAAQKEQYSANLGFQQQQAAQQAAQHQAMLDMKRMLAQQQQQQFEQELAMNQMAMEWGGMGPPLPMGPTFPSPSATSAVGSSSSPSYGKGFGGAL